MIVGGGIVGISTALELATRGLRVTLLEKGTVAGEQSGRNWGFIRQQGRVPEELPLMIRANGIWSRMEGVGRADQSRNTLRITAREEQPRGFRR